MIIVITIIQIKIANQLPAQPTPLHATPARPTPYHPTPDESFTSMRAQLWSKKSVLNIIYYTWATLLEACFRPPEEPMGSQNHSKAPFDPPGRPWVTSGPAKMLSHDVPILNLATQKSRLLFLFLFGVQFYKFNIFLLLFLSQALMLYTNLVKIYRLACDFSLPNSEIYIISYVGGTPCR